MALLVIFIVCYFAHGRVQEIIIVCLPAVIAGWVSAALQHRLKTTTTADTTAEGLTRTKRCVSATVKPWQLCPCLSTLSRMAYFGKQTLKLVKQYVSSIPWD